MSSIISKHYGVFLQGTIRDAIEDSVTWPVRKIIPIIPGDYRYITNKCCLV